MEDDRLKTKPTGEITPLQKSFAIGGDGKLRGSAQEGHLIEYSVLFMYWLVSMLFVAIGRKGGPSRARQLAPRINKR